MSRGLLLIAAVLLASPTLASAQPEDDAPAAKKAAARDAAKDTNGVRARGKVKERRGGKERLFDFTGLQLAGSMRMPQLLYFLERAQEELERASLKRRSFIPEMVRSLDEDAL